MYGFEETIRDARSRRGITQEELAKLAGVSRHTIVNLESGTAPDLKVSSLAAVLNALGYRLSAAPVINEPLGETDESYRTAVEQVTREYHLDGDIGYASI